MTDPWKDLTSDELAHKGFAAIKTEGGRVYLNFSADVRGAKLGAGTVVWKYSTVLEAKLGRSVMVGSYCFIHEDVYIGSGTRIQNHVSIYRGTHIGDAVFIGPHACLTNDRNPYVHTDDTPLIPDEIWIGDGAVIGANATLVAPVVIGMGAMVGAGAVVTRNVPPFTQVVGIPAKVVEGHWLCVCREKIDRRRSSYPYDGPLILNPWKAGDKVSCENCKRDFELVEDSNNLWGVWPVLMPLEEKGTDDVVSRIRTV